MEVLSIYWEQQKHHFCAGWFWRCARISMTVSNFLVWVPLKHLNLETWFWIRSAEQNNRVFHAWFGPFSVLYLEKVEKCSMYCLSNLVNWLGPKNVSHWFRSIIHVTIPSSVILIIASEYIGTNLLLIQHSEPWTNITSCPIYFPLYIGWLLGILGSKLPNIH